MNQRPVRRRRDLLDERRQNRRDLLDLVEARIGVRGRRFAFVDLGDEALAASAVRCAGGR
jgi:hypothetical protein